MNHSSSDIAIINMDNNILIDRYCKNNITSAIVFGGLEPFEQFDDLKIFIGLSALEFGVRDLLKDGYDVVFNYIVNLEDLNVLQNAFTSVFRSIHTLLKPKTDSFCGIPRIIQAATASVRAST